MDLWAILISPRNSCDDPSYAKSALVYPGAAEIRLSHGIDIVVVG
jgi:hypothetical protein